MSPQTRKALAVAMLTIAGLSAAAALDRPAETRAGTGSVAADRHKDGDVTLKRKHRTSAHAQAFSTASSSASASAGASASASASTSVTAGPGEAECAADAVASAESDGERVTVRDSRRSGAGQDGCNAEARAVTGDAPTGED